MHRGQVTDPRDERIAALSAENERLREDNKVLRAELIEYKAALQDARHVIKEAVERIKPLWPFVMAWLPDSADRFEARMIENSNNAIDEAMKAK